MASEPLEAASAVASSGDSLLNWEFSDRGHENEPPRAVD